MPQLCPPCGPSNPFSLGQLTCGLLLLHNLRTCWGVREAQWHGGRGRRSEDPVVPSSQQPHPPRTSPQVLLWARSDAQAGAPRPPASEGRCSFGQACVSAQGPDWASRGTAGVERASGGHALGTLEAGTPSVQRVPAAGALPGSLDQAPFGPPPLLRPPGCPGRPLRGHWTALCPAAAVAPPRPGGLSSCRTGPGGPSLPATRAAAVSLLRDQPSHSLARSPTLPMQLGARLPGCPPPAWPHHGHGTREGSGLHPPPGGLGNALNDTHASALGLVRTCTAGTGTPGSALPAYGHRRHHQQQQDDKGAEGGPSSLLVGMHGLLCHRNCESSEGFCGRDRKPKPGGVLEGRPLSPLRGALQGSAPGDRTGMTVGFSASGWRGGRLLSQVALPGSPALAQGPGGLLTWR